MATRTSISFTVTDHELDACDDVEIDIDWDTYSMPTIELRSVGNAISMSLEHATAVHEALGRVIENVNAQMVMAS